MKFASSGRLPMVLLVSVLGGTAVVLAGSGMASGRTATKSLIEIHEQGTENQALSMSQGGVRGKFTIELRLSPFGPAGTTVIYGGPDNTRNVNGEAQIPFTATDHLTSKAGTIALAVTGTHIDLNSKLTPSGDAVGPAVEYGTWKIDTATGIYQGWSGGGRWAAAIWGYGRRSQPYSVEWDGYISQ